MLAIMAKPWEKQTYETQKQFDAFVAYRDLGRNRSILAAAMGAGMATSTASTWEKWSAQNGWVARVHDYDLHLERIKREEREETIREMGERHALQAIRIQDKILAAIPHIQPDLLEPKDLARLLDIAVKIERQARGMAGEVHQHDLGSDTKLDMTKALAQQLMLDSGAMGVIHDALGRTENGSKSDSDIQPGELGVRDERGEVDPGPPSDQTEPEAG